MAQVRTSGKQAAARKAARERAVERAAEFRHRQEQLEELAAEYFLAADTIDGIYDAAEARIREIRDEAAVAVAKAEERAQEIIGRMLDTKVTRDEVAERLGISVRDVKRSKTKAAPVTTAVDDDDATPAGAEDVQGDAHESVAA